MYHPFLCSRGVQGFDPQPFYPLLGEGSLSKIDYRKRVPLILTSLLEDLAGPKKVSGR